MNSVLSRAAIRFRPSTEDDVPFLRQLYATTREDELRMVDWTDEFKTSFLDSQFAAQKKHYEEYFGAAEFLVIEAEREPMGRLYVHRDEEEIHIIDIALMPQYRGHGLGTVLLQELLDEGKATGRKVTIYVEHFNPARHLYDRLGFRHIDTNGVYHFMEWTAG